MIDELQKQNELRATRDRDRREKARTTLKKNNTGKNKGQAKNTINDAKNLAKNATPWGILSLLGEFKLFSDWMYGLALFAAVFKDILDLIEATGVLYIVVIVATFCVSIFIAMMMILGSVSSGHGRKQHKIIRSWLILLGGTTAEIIFGVNFLRIETLTVLIIYALLLSDRKQNKQTHKAYA